MKVESNSNRYAYHYVNDVEEKKKKNFLNANKNLFITYFTFSWGKKKKISH